MSRRFAISVGLLSISTISLLQGQHNGGDLSGFNVNIGGGVATPLNPTGRYAGVSGNFRVGAGYNINSRNSIDGEFGWTGLPPNISLHPINAPFGNINLYSLTADYRYHVDRVGGSAFGLYAIGGGGWYYRHFTVDKNYLVPPATPCLPIYLWWGYACDGGIVTQTIFSRGSSAGGVNAGVGMTLRFGDSGWKFYMESRYNYAFSSVIPTTFIPVTLGFRYN